MRQGLIPTKAPEYRAECTCGWRGSVESDRGEAIAQVKEHAHEGDLCTTVGY